MDNFAPTSQKNLPIQNYDHHVTKVKKKNNLKIVCEEYRELYILTNYKALKSCTIYPYKCVKNKYPDLLTIKVYRSQLTN